MNISELHAKAARTGSSSESGSAAVSVEQAALRAKRIAALPERAVRDLKRVINRACHLDVEGAMELETEATIRGFFDPGTEQRITQNRNKREQGSGKNEG